LKFPFGNESKGLHRPKSAIFGGRQA